MRAALIEDLFQAFERLTTANSTLAAAIAKDTEAPLWLPPPYDASDIDGHALVAKALTRLWHQDKDIPTPPSGLLCGTPKVLTAAKELNETKEGFRAAINAIREETSLSNQRRRLIFSAIRKRDPHVADALETVGITRLNLSYTDQRIIALEHTPLSVSWTWARSHQKIRSYSYKEAVDIAEQQESDDIREMALRLLAALPEGTRVAEVVRKKHQLRANVKLQAGKEVIRRSLVTASVVIAPCERLPVIRWPSPPDDSPANRLRRSDATIEPEPYIKPLNFHLYRS